MAANRKTEQKSSIVEALSRAGRPLSVSELYEMARARTPSLGIATVYRNLKSMTENNVIQVVEMPGEVDRYELAGKDHHHHFHCRSCDRVYDVAGCVDVSRLTPTGFELQDHEIILYGNCPACGGGRPELG